ncbi:hypothetical protein C8R45DRAFT_1008840 [Mycena sanguinolenta]|nr:hypothetical protein C8R45DRAFT_1008840 [Mycena sanguinolenta]
MRTILSSSRLLFNPPPRLPLCTSTRFYTLTTTTDCPPCVTRAGRVRSLISTLDPSRLTSHDHLDLSRRESISIGFSSCATTKALLTYQTAGSRFRVPFPGASSGFLYYYRDLHAAPLEASIRFRVTADNDPSSSFRQGRDLLLPSGRPWEILLLQVATRLRFVSIRDQLLQENLVTERQLSQCRDILLMSSRHRSVAEGTLFRLTQEFAVNFTTEIHLTVVGDALYSLRSDCFRSWFHRKQYFPWAGSAIARFEPSTSTEHRAVGRRVAHLRIVRVLNPVSRNLQIQTPGRMVKPEAGQLLRFLADGHAPKPWAYDIDGDSAKGAAFRVLWDNSSRYDSSFRAVATHNENQSRER